MVRALVLVTLFLVGCASKPKSDSEAEAGAATVSDSQTVAINRYIAVKACYSIKKNCVGPTVKDAEKSAVTIKLEPFGKAGEKGVSGRDEYSVTDSGVTFYSEVRVTKKDGVEGYHIYMMLRSGRKREGKVRTFVIQDFTKLFPLEVRDEPIDFPGGTLRAELVVGPSVPITK